MNRRRRYVLACAAVAGLLVAPGVAAAAPGGVAYLDGGQVWVATLDGGKKIQLSSGDAWWNAVTQSSSGGVLATKNEPGKIAQLSAFQSWDASGNPARFGPLNHDASGASLAMPLSLAMASSNGVMLYGYSALYGFYPNTVFAQGYYTQSTQTAAVGQPVTGLSNLHYPSLAGDRVVGASGPTSLSVLNADQNFVGSAATPWHTNFDFSAVGTGAQIRRSSLSGTGDVMAFEVAFDGPNDRVFLVKSAGLGGAYLDGCWLPTAGEPSSPSVSPDGTRIAWKDDQGVKVAGAPDFAAVAPCNLTLPPVVISPAGKDPSLGPIDVAAILSSGKSAPSLFSPAGLTIRLTAPPRVRVLVRVTVAPRLVGRKGTKPIVIATGKGFATATGALKMRLRATAAGRALERRLHGKRVTLVIQIGTKKVTKVIRLD